MDSLCSICDELKSTVVCHVHHKTRTQEAPTKVYPSKIAKIALKYAIIWAWNTLSWRGLDHVHPQKGNFKHQVMLSVGFLLGYLRDIAHSSLVHHRCNIEHTSQYLTISSLYILS